MELFGKGSFPRILLIWLVSLGLGYFAGPLYCGAWFVIGGLLVLFCEQVPGKWGTTFSNLYAELQWLVTWNKDMQEEYGLGRFTPSFFILLFLFLISLGTAYHNQLVSLLGLFNK